MVKPIKVKWKQITTYRGSLARFWRHLSKVNQK